MTAIGWHAIAQEKERNFKLTVTSDNKIFFQKLQMIGADGYESIETVQAKEYNFSNPIKRYGLFNLSVTYADASTKKINSVTVPLFLQAGETKIIFQGTSGKYSITGASAVAMKDFVALHSKDEVCLKKIQSYETKLNQFEKVGNKKAASQMRDSVEGALKFRKESVFGNFVREHPNADLSLYAMGLYSMINSENPLEVKSLLSVMGKDLQATDEMMEIRRNAEENEQFMIGKTAPDFTQADTNGTVISLSSLQGKYILIDFWASWCKPCRAQNPSLVKLHKKFNDKGFSILGVSLDSKKESWLKAIRTDKLAWQHVSDLKFWQNDVAQQYKIYHVPQNFLLDPKGVIIAKNLSEEELDELLEKKLIKNTK